MELFEKFEAHNCIIKIHQDTLAEDPRQEWDHSAIMVCFHNRFTLGDKDGFDQVLEGLDLESDVSPLEMYQSIQNNNDWHVLPLYLYEHSGITMRTRDFADRWDSGQVGFICLPPEVIEKEGIQYPQKYMEQEVKEYDQFLTGDVWYFEVEHSKSQGIESCGGVYGLEQAKEEAINDAKYLDNIYHKNLDLAYASPEI